MDGLLETKKLKAIKEQDFEKAAKLRDEEKHTTQKA